MTFAAMVVGGVGLGVAEIGAGAAGLSAVGAAGFAAVTSMATVSASSLLSAASLAWSIGSTLMSMFGNSSAGASGPRLTNLHMQAAAYGTPRKRFWGVDRMAGTLIWLGSDGKGGRGWREHKHDIGGKGKGGGAFFYTYEADFAIGINAASNCKGVIRIWADNKLIYDHSKDATLETRVGSGLQLEKGQKGKVIFYDGNENQKPPALMEALTGIGKCSAYRNQFIALFNKFDLTEYGHIPSFSFECYTDGQESWDELALYDVNAAYPYGAGRRSSWSYVDANGEIEVLALLPGFYSYNSIFPSGPLAGQPVGQRFRLLADGSVITVDRQFIDSDIAKYVADPATGHSDEPAFMATNAGVNVLVLPNQDRTVTIDPGIASLWESDDFGVRTCSFWQKKGDLLYVMFNVGFVGDPHIHVFDVAGPPGTATTATPLLNSEVLNVFSGHLQPSGGFMVGEEFMWALRHGNSSTVDILYKLSATDLSLLDVITLPEGSARMLDMFVDNDDLIQFTGTAAGAALGFYEYVPSTNTLTLIGTAATAPTGYNGGNLFVRNGVWYTGGLTIGIYDINIHAWAPGIVANCALLWQIQRDICIACGLDEEDFDVTELTDCIPGYTLDQQMTGRDATLPLQRYAHYDARERDLKIDFVKRGHDSVATIDPQDMAVRSSLDQPLSSVRDITRAQETELPFQLHIRYRDKNANYETGHVLAPRQTTESKLLVTLDLPVVTDEERAIQIGDFLLRDYWDERDPMEITFSRKHMLLDVCDNVDIPIERAI